ncbi:MAG: DUF3800 domain-containing protein [Patescibacteria group bacterium]
MLTENKVPERFVFYLDDSGTNENPCYLGGFIIKNGMREANFQLELKKIKQDILGNEDAYIKWSPTKRECPEQYALPPAKRNKLREEVLNLLKEYETTIICSVIRNDDNYWNSQCFALSRLAERFVFFLSGKVGFNATKQGYYPHGQMIIDYLGPKKKVNLAKTYNDLWKKGHMYSDDFEDIYIEGKDWKKIELRHCLRETLFYTHAKYCELLQVADFTTGAVREYFKKDNKKYYDVIKDNIRDNKGGRVNGFGIIFAPKDVQYDYNKLL